MDFHVIIPARLDSTRLPGKVLIDIGGKPMLQHVYENARESGANSVVIATDNNQVAEVAEGFGATVCMTSSDHQSGSERLAEAVEARDYEPDEIVVNLQADEPFMPPKVIRQVAAALDDHSNVKVASVCEAMTSVDELLDPNTVKVILNRRHFAMYFSRSPVPWQKALDQQSGEIDFNNCYYRHIGIYASRVSFLGEYIEIPSCPLEGLEKLEQLRILWNGIKIFMTISDTAIPPGIDTESDLKRARDYIKK